MEKTGWKLLFGGLGVILTNAPAIESKKTCSGIFQKCSRAFIFEGASESKSKKAETSHAETDNAETSEARNGNAETGNGNSDAKKDDEELVLQQ